MWISLYNIIPCLCLDVKYLLIWNTFMKYPYDAVLHVFGDRVRPEKNPYMYL